MFWILASNDSNLSELIRVDDMELHPDQDSDPSISYDSVSLKNFDWPCEMPYKVDPSVQSEMKTFIKGNITELNQRFGDCFTIR